MEFLNVLDECIDDVLQDYIPIKTEMQGVTKIIVGTTGLVTAVALEIFGIDHVNAGIFNWNTAQLTEICTYTILTGTAQIAFATPIILTAGVLIGQYCL